MPLDPRIALAAKPLDVGSTFNSILNNIGKLDSIQQNRQAQPYNNQIQQDNLIHSANNIKIQQSNIDRNQIASMDSRSKSRLASLATFGAEVLPMLKSGDFAGAKQSALTRRENLRRRIANGEEVDTVETDQFIQLLESNPELATQRAAQAVELGDKLGIFAGSNISVDQSNRQSLLKDVQSGIDPVTGQLKPVEQLTATERTAAIGLKLIPGASGGVSKTVDVGGVPHIFDPVKNTLVPAVVDGEKITSSTVGDNKADIKQREKFGELQGSSRAEAIDKGLEAMKGIDKNMLNLDRAIATLDSGAGTGAAEKLFPSIKAATKELEQIQGELTLDVIGSVTLGAISATELDLARDIALPLGLDEVELRDFLQRKKAAQNKLRDYYNEQIQFLDQGGTVAGFLRKKEAEKSAKNQPNQTNQFQGFKILSVE
jgi:hypothetical protein